VATHERLMTKGGTRLDLDHYLEVFARKPGAFPDATALEQARTTGRFTPTHYAWWAAAVTAHGEAEGTRALIEVLLLHRRMRHEDVVASIAAALRAGALTADAVVLEARKIADQSSPDCDTPAPADTVPAPPGRPGPAAVALRAPRNGADGSGHPPPWPALTRCRR
jgi:hypothetical protein